MMTLLALKHVSHGFMGNNRQWTPALRNVSLKLPRSTFTCLIGPSGCGKSTLLRVAAGLLQPDSGEVVLEGQTHRQPRRDISIVFQRDNLMPWRTVFQNIVLPLQLFGVASDEQYERARHWIDIAGLRGFENSYPAELSGGMAQRVTLARGLITQPDLLLLDEPFGALDELTREAMWQELLRLWHTTQSTVLMVTHSIREAILLADRVMVMSQRPGHIIHSFDVPFGRPRLLELLTDPDFNELESQVRSSIET